ncbi:lipoyl synthase [Oceanispirochaeta sp.]|jgi:lipoic acid synthetase|uniref:lipoyl synthase n=1 Tax=Oceanispirochaeta sp. TaxID=2035350 RepID=UPI0026379DCD|nr:lipoyl synthase [Oceanispirochaeta sp.]MDA3956033.1 lipoyl synthase [Oceanispirochaeta sp.]
MDAENTGDKVLRKPDWLKIPIRRGNNLAYVEDLLKDSTLNTVCKEANCPNRMECYSNKTATFMILGSVCTRGCCFCNVEGGIPQCVDPEEPRKLAEAVKALGLKFAVVTSVTRDDLEDGGASHFALVIQAVHALEPAVGIEVLIPDFQGNKAALGIVVAAGPEILNHNVETVPSLYAQVRPEADYRQSLELLGRVKKMDSRIYTKSGLMLGLGETEDEVLSVLEDLRKSEVDFLTMGQYLAPSKKHLSVKKYISPETFDRYREKALLMGFKGAACAPFVRSSYNASLMLDAVK